MDRRSFLRRAIDQTTRVSVQYADQWASRKAQRWVRPPFALDELDFLLACTRCDACVEACPHDVIFALGAILGPQVADTPALDLLNRGCRLCDEWPCVKSCGPGALRISTTGAQDNLKGADETDSATPAPLALVRVDPKQCVPYQGPECGACANSCPVPGALLWASNRPRIDPQKCLGCGQCREACITDPPALTITAIGIRERPRVLNTP